MVVEESYVSRFTDFVQNLLDGFVCSLYGNLFPLVVFVSGCMQAACKKQHAQSNHQETTGKHSV